MEKLVDLAHSQLDLHELDMANLRFNIFLLKVMPSYTGMPETQRKPDDN